jgi:hypothetical protein
MRIFKWLMSFVTIVLVLVLTIWGYIIPYYEYKYYLSDLYADPGSELDLSYCLKTDSLKSFKYKVRISCRSKIYNDQTAYKIISRPDGAFQANSYQRFPGNSSAVSSGGVLFQNKNREVLELSPYRKMRFRRSWRSTRSGSYLENINPWNGLGREVDGIKAYGNNASIVQTMASLSRNLCSEHKVPLAVESVVKELSSYGDGKKIGVTLILHRKLGLIPDYLKGSDGTLVLNENIGLTSCLTVKVLSLEKAYAFISIYDLKQPRCQKQFSVNENKSDDRKHKFKHYPFLFESMKISKYELSGNVRRDDEQAQHALNFLSRYSRAAGQVLDKLRDEHIDYKDDRVCPLQI